MSQRSKRFWGSTNQADFVGLVEGMAQRVSDLIAQAPIGSPQYEALSRFLAAIREAAIFLGRDWAKPHPSHAVEVDRERSTAGGTARAVRTDLSD